MSRRTVITLATLLVAATLVVATGCGDQPSSNPDGKVGRIPTMVGFMGAASDVNAALLQMIVTINGLAHGEDATLVIGPQTVTPEVENPLFEGQIAGTGAVITEDITVALEDGYYVLLLRARDHYFRDPKGYMFVVRNSTVVNPTGRVLTFNLKPPPTYPTIETFIDLSSPPRPPITVGPIPLWARVVEPVAIALAVIVVAAITLATWLRRSRVSILLWLVVGLVLGAVAGLFVGLPINPEQAAVPGMVWGGLIGALLGAFLSVNRFRRRSSGTSS